MEKLSSKTKRKKADKGAPGGYNSEERVSPKKKSSHINLVAMMEASLEMKRNDQEQQRQFTTGSSILELQNCSKNSISSRCCCNNTNNINNSIRH